MNLLTTRGLHMQRPFANRGGIPRLPTIGGQPVWPIRFLVSAGSAIGIGIQEHWWVGLIDFFIVYFVLAFVDYQIQQWKIAYYEQHGHWPWRRPPE